MITKEQAVKIAKSVVPNIEKLIMYVSLDKLNANLFNGIQDNCRYISYSYTNPNKTIFEGFISDEGMFIEKETGEILYKGTLMNEG